MWIAAYAGEIVAVGHGYEVRDRLDLDDGAIIIDAPGMVAVPGLIDCHTHACFAGDRVDEFEQALPRRVLRGDPRERRRHPLDRRATRAAAADELSRARGRTSRDARARGDDGRGQVRLRARPRDRDGHAARDPGGGYGRPRTSSRPARGARRPRGRRSADAYIQLCIDELLPEVVEWGLADAVDVFCERGAFDVEQSRRYLEAAATSVSRCDCTATSSRRSARSSWRSSWRALDRPSRGDGAQGHRQAGRFRRGRRRAADCRADARAPAPAGARARRRRRPLALATDFNPGSSPCDSLPR